MPKRLLTALAALACIALQSCDDNDDNQIDATPVAQCSAGEPAAANYAVLVDLSGTWHNEQSRTLNSKLLKIIGAALVKATEDSAACPTAIRYHVIGSNSLYRQPVCTVNYVPTLLSQKGGDPTLITNRRGLQAYLSETCPLLLNADEEKQTQVTAALVTALNSMAGVPHALRRIVVYSDLKEEPIQKYDLSNVDFSGVDVILLYRALSEDQKDPTLLDQRISQWTQQLEKRGARVLAAPDSGVGASVGDLAKLLASGIPVQR